MTKCGWLLPQPGTDCSQSWCDDVGRSIQAHPAAILCLKCSIQILLAVTRLLAHWCKKQAKQKSNKDTISSSPEGGGPQDVSLWRCITEQCKCSFWNSQKKGGDAGGEIPPSSFPKGAWVRPTVVLLQSLWVMIYFLPCGPSVYKRTSWPFSNRGVVSFTHCHSGFNYVSCY